MKSLENSANIGRFLYNYWRFCYSLGSGLVVKITQYISLLFPPAMLALTSLGLITSSAQARGPSDAVSYHESDQQVVPALSEILEVVFEPVTRKQTQTPAAAASFADADNDGVEDSKDLCAASTPGFPVRNDGCALLDGVLQGVNFGPASAELVAGSEVQLDYMVDLLVNQFPDARIELHAHTDNAGDVRSQAILTRGRLKTVGTYLVNRGVRANRLVLRSFGGSRPLYDNSSPEGRESNNRFEVLERPR